MGPPERAYRYSTLKAELVFENNARRDSFGSVPLPLTACRQGTASAAPQLPPNQQPFSPAECLACALPHKLLRPPIPAPFSRYTIAAVAGASLIAIGLVVNP